nr:MAG TPA: hypothetical protein [Caudoviricetes sp.]
MNHPAVESPRRRGFGLPQASGSLLASTDYTSER